MITTTTLRLVELLLLMIVPAGFSYFLAKYKGRNVALWTTLGLIPALNLVFLVYLVFATSLRLETKTDMGNSSLEFRE